MSDGSTSDRLNPDLVEICNAIKAGADINTALLLAQLVVVTVSLAAQLATLQAILERIPGPPV